MQDSFTYIRDGLKFEWLGHALVEVYHLGSITPFDVLNVFDYEAGAPRIPVTMQSLANYVDSVFDELQEAWGL